MSAFASIKTTAATAVTAMTLLAAMFAVSTTHAAIPGPNDPRYPDVIVEPKVTCDKEGVFPHPRNCSWYYRCVDRMNIGYYWTYHFECEPGTVFSDELDQCIFPFLTGPPCGTAGVPVPTSGPPAPTSGTLQTAIQTSQPTTSSMTSSTTSTTTTTSRPVTTVQTTPSTTTAPAVTPQDTTVQTTTSAIPAKCSFAPENCEVHVPCPPDHLTRTLCSGCYVEGIYVTAFFLCGQEQGKLYDRERNICVDDPSLNPTCSAATTPTTTTTTTTPPPTTTTTTTTTPPPTTTTTTTTTPPPTTTTTTTTSTTTTTTTTPTTTTTTTTTPPTTTTPAIVTLVHGHFVNCAVENMIPSDEWILNKFCEDYFLCTPEGKYMGRKKLCNKYYQCLITPENQWDLKIMTCPEGLLFTHEENKCVEKPTAEETCNFGR